MAGPAVSVVMAVRNAERYLAAALDSIAAQTYPAHEIIVVDGGSSDRSVRIANSYPGVRCVPQAGGGFANAWSEGIGLARAPLIAFLDSDDIWAADKLALQAAWLRDHPEQDYVIGRVAFFAEAGEALPRGFKPSLLDGSHLAYMPGTTLFRRSVFDRIGTFAPDWQIVGDIAWFQKLRNANAAHGAIDRVVLRKRVHAENLSYSTDWAIYRRELLSLLKSGLDARRRQAAGDPSRPAPPSD